MTGNKEGCVRKYDLVRHYINDVTTYDT